METSKSFLMTPGKFTKDVIDLTDWWLGSYDILTCSLHHFTISIHNHKDIEDLTILLPALQKIAFTDKITWH